MSLPLAGIRILAVEQYGAGPFGTQHLADMGAEVIKIENPHDGGDVSRSVGPHFLSNGDSLFFEGFNRNKKSIRLDLKHPDGIKVLHQLLEESHVLFNNLRGDLPVKLGLTYADVSHIRKDLVCVHLSAYGREGSRASWPGYDYLMQAEAGYLSLTGEPNGPPSRFGLSMVDLMTGTTAALGIVSALLGARQTGVGMDVDVSLFDVAMHNLAYLATWYLNAGHMTTRAPYSAHPSLVPSQLYRTSDGWIFIMCNKEKFWPIMASLMGHPEWSTRPEYRTFADRLKNRENFNQEVGAVMQCDSTDNWMKKFAGKVPAAPVYNVAQALDNPFVKERRDIVAGKRFLEEDPSADTLLEVKAVASPLRFSGSVMPAQAAPAMGQDTQSVLMQAGLTPEQIQFLRDKGVV